MFQRYRGILLLAGALVLLTAGIALAATVASGEIVGAPNTAVLRADGDVRWILPGPRRLDPAVFGTPDQPLGFEDDVGVPLDARLTTADGSAYTTTATPTPFSDDWSQVTGQTTMRVVDRTAVGGPTTQDEINATFEFTGPDKAIRPSTPTGW